MKAIVVITKHLSAYKLNARRLLGSAESFACSRRSGGSLQFSPLVHSQVQLPRYFIATINLYSIFLLFLDHMSASSLHVNHLVPPTPEAERPSVSTLAWRRICEMDECAYLSFISARPALLLPRLFLFPPNASQLYYVFFPGACVYMNCLVTKVYALRPAVSSGFIVLYRNEVSLF